MKKILLILISTIVLSSCSPLISTTSTQTFTSLKTQEDVIVFQKEATLPKNIQLIGKTEIGDSGFTTNCGLDVMIEKAKIEARKIGANAIVITEHILPSIWGSSCHRIKADLVKLGVQSNEPLSIIKTDSIKKNDGVISSNNKIVKTPRDYNKFLFSFNYGLGYRTAGVESGTPQIEKDFQNKLGSGNSFQIKAGYKVNRNSYYGLVYSRFSSSASLNNIIFTEPNGFEGSGSINQKNTINYIGLVAGWTLNGFLKNDTFNFDLSLGYINYSEKRKFYNTYEATGGNLGIGMDISYYFGISKYIKVGPTFSFNGGALKNYEINGNNGYKTTIKLPEKTAISLYRIDLMLGTYFEF
jgi:hypothetical protein